VNAVVYVSDALRVDHLGCYGASFLNTRTVDELAAGGARFEQAITAAPWTGPSMISMVTGLYPHRHGFLHWDAYIDPETPTVFRPFAAAGYGVASFVFDDSYLFRDIPEAGVLGETTTLDATVAWLRANATRPFFLFVHSWATHMPYHVRHAARSDWRAAKQAMLTTIRANTADGLEALREEYRIAAEHQSEVLVASLLEELETLGVRDRTMIAFLADHGESWGERFADKEDVQGVYHLHGATLYDEIARVPLILSAPGQIEPAVVPHQVRSVDLAPTLIDLCGLGNDGLGDGLSLLPLLDGREQADRDAVIATSDRGRLSQLAIRRPPWKLIRHLGTGLEETYRLDLDPRELVDRTPEAPSDLAEILLRLELERVDGPELTADEEAVIARRLSNLGYL
jgi:arylsulfatase A-like enzyme